MSWYKKAQKYPSVLTSDEMASFVVDYGLQDWQGELDYNEAKDIARYAKEWKLTEIPLDLFEWVTDPSYKTDLPPIIGKNNGEYDVLDGKHRIGAAKARGEKTILAYVGEFYAYQGV